VFLLPVCDKGNCSQKAMAYMTTHFSKAEANQKRADRGACEVCEKVDGSMRCAGCKQVNYCGKECQRKDWKSHKSVCGKSVQDMRKA